jgi:hypothetical protein
MSVQSDSLLVVTGLFPKAISPQEHAASEAIPTTFAKRAARWVKNEELAEFKFVEPPKDFDKLFAKVAEPLTELEVEAWAMGLDPDDLTLQLEFQSSLVGAREYLKNAWPAFNVEGAAGPKLLPLSFDDAAEVWSLFQVLNDPERVLDEMDSRTLTATQALAFRECLPDLYKLVDEAIVAELIEKRAKDDDYSLGWERESVLNTLRGEPPEEPYVPPPPPPEPEGKLKLDPEREKTQEQVSSAPKTRK